MNRWHVLEKLQLVTNRLLHLQTPELEENDRCLSDETEKIGFYKRDFGMEEWDWPQGVGLFGLSKLQSLYHDNRYEAYISSWMDRQVNNGIPCRNINTTAPLLTLMDAEKNEDFCKRWMNWLLNDLPRTEENGFQHVTTGETKDRVRLHENEIWVDTIFMAVLFSAKMGVKYDKADWREESLYQLLIHIKYLYDKKTNLLYHGWSFTDRDNFSEAFWCRGNSWFTVAVPEYLQLMGNYLDKGVYHYLTEALTGQVRTLCRFQAKDGLWHTLIDDPDSYTEVSGSAAMAAGMLKAVRLGILPEEPYFSAGMKTLHAVMDNIAEDGTVLEVSAGTPIGKTKENYKSIIKAPMAYGQALAMVLLTESLAHL